MNNALFSAEEEDPNYFSIGSWNILRSEITGIKKQYSIQKKREKKKETVLNWNECAFFWFFFMAKLPGMQDLTRNWTRAPPALGARF